MPRSADATRKRILDAAYNEFRKKGYSRVGIDQIAAAAKITKRSLYYHFKSKDELLAAVLERQHERMTISFHELGKDVSNDAKKLIETLFTRLAEWGARPRFAASGFTRVAIELTDLPGHPARKIAKRHKTEMQAYLTRMFGACGVERSSELAREVWLLCEGAMVMMLIHGDIGYAQAGAAAAKKLLSQTRGQG
jgi:AcrR family transcriptional regulator